MNKDLLEGPAMPTRAWVVAPGGTLGERSGGVRGFIGACPDCGSQLAFIGAAPSATCAASRSVGEVVGAAVSAPS